MTDASFSSPVSPRRHLAPGIWLVSILGLSIFGLGIGLIASAGSLPRAPVLERAGGALSMKANTVAGSIVIPGFQRRGNTLVGEVVTRDGTSLRLVFDAQTKTLIGMRTISPAPGISVQR